MVAVSLDGLCVCFPHPVAATSHAFVSGFLLWVPVLADSKIIMEPNRFIFTLSFYVKKGLLRLCCLAYLATIYHVTCIFFLIYNFVPCACNACIRRVPLGLCPKFLPLSVIDCGLVIPLTVTLHHLTAGIASLRYVSAKRPFSFITSTELVMILPATSNDRFQQS